MRTIFRLSVFFVLLTLLASAVAVTTSASLSAGPAASAAPWQAKVDPWVLDTAARGQTEFLVFLAEQADLSGAKSLPTKLEKGRYVFRQLTEVAARTQPPVLAALDSLGVAYRPYWVANMIWVRGGMAVVQSMAQRSDVAHLYANPSVKLESPVEQGMVGGRLAPEAVEWNITKVGAPNVWAAGYSGQGAVVAGQDTGYDWDHPALKNQYRGWDGAAADHNYNWHDSIHENDPHTPPGNPCGFDSPLPCDDSAHGTHTMGTMVGDDGAGNQIGMAPGARWIGCRNMEEGWGMPSTYAECYQFFIAPYPIGGTPAQGDPAKAPDVINNSWGCPADEGCTDPNALLSVVNAVRAAGILTAHSAGNSGSGCSTVSTPAAIYEASFTVGATDSGDNIASFSSRGPVTVDGSNRLKPNISAPGVSIRSSVPGGGYAGGWSGTSMAAPHVAGMVALLISAQPNLAGQVDALETLIEQTALPRTTTQTCGGVPGSSIPNNTYGWGRIDAYQAMRNVPHSFDITKTASPEVVAPGQAITYTLAITHLHSISPTANVVLTDTIPAGTSFVSATGSFTLTGEVVTWGFPGLAANQSESVTLVVQTAITATGVVTNSLYGVRSDDVATILGSPVGTPVVPLSLELGKTAPPLAAPGSVITYTLAVTNPHPSAATYNLILTDTLPAGTVFVSATEPYTIAGGRLTWERASLAAGAAWSVELAVRVPLTFTGTIANLDYGVRSDEVAAVAGAPVSTEIYALSLAKTASVERVAPGWALTYTLTVTNLHPASATHHLVLTDALPAGVILLSATEPYTLAGDTVTWERAALPAGEAWAVTLAVQIPVTTSLASVTNADYGAHSDEAGLIAGAPVQTEIVPFALELSKTGPAEVSPGGLLTYTLTVTNPHPFAAAHNLLLTDTLPVSTTFVSATGAYTLTGGGVTWELASLGAGEHWTVTLTVRVSVQARGAVDNVAYGVRSDEVLAPVVGAVVSTVIKLYKLYLPLIVR